MWLTSFDLGLRLRIATSLGAVISINTQYKLAHRVYSNPRSLVSNYICIIIFVVIIKLCMLWTQIWRYCSQSIFLWRMIRHLRTLVTEIPRCASIGLSIIKKTRTNWTNCIFTCFPIPAFLQQVLWLCYPHGIFFSCKSQPKLNNNLNNAPCCFLILWYSYMQ